MCIFIAFNFPFLGEKFHIQDVLNAIVSVVKWCGYLKCTIFLSFFKIYISAIDYIVGIEST